MNPNKRNYLIGKGFANSLFAALLASMITNISTVVDGIITGNFLGPAALSAIGICTPVLMVLDSMYDLMFDGAVSKASIDLGTADKKALNGRLSSALFTGYLVSAGTVLILFFCLPSISRWLVPEDELVRRYFVQYAGILILFRLVSNLFLPFTRYFRALGHPKATTLALLVASVGNLIFDLIFVRMLNLQVAGSAWATICGWIAAVPIIIYYYKKIGIIHLCNPIPWVRTFLKENILCALPGVVGNILVSVLGLTINNVVQKISGTEGITIVTIGMQILTLAGVAVFGLRKTMQLLGGIFCGEKDYEGLTIVYKKVLLWTVVSMGIVTFLLVGFPDVIIRLYGCRDQSLLAFQKRGLRCFSLFIMPLYLSFVLSTIYQILRRYRLSLLGSVSPVVLLMLLIQLSNHGFPKLFWWSFGCAGWIAFLFLLLLAYRAAKQDSNFLFPSLIPQKNDFASIFLTIPYSMDSVEETLETVRTFCIQNHISGQKTDLAELFCEEMAQNIISYAKQKKEGYFEIRVCITDTVHITCKDDGVPFNPILEEKIKKTMTMQEKIDNKGRSIISAPWYQVSYDYICGQNVTRCSI